jgi:hypothetical protein
MNTPWGKSDSVKRYAPGINFYSTPRHGGIKVSKTVLALMPPHLRNDDGWYEEDLEWCKVAMAFPHFFTGAMADLAKKLHKEYFNSDGTYTSDEFRKNLRKMEAHPAPPPAYL